MPFGMNSPISYCQKAFFIKRKKKLVLLLSLPSFMLDCITASTFIFTMQDGKLPIMIAAAREQCELVKILLPRTKPLPSVPDWSVDGTIRTMKYPQSEPSGMPKSFQSLWRLPHEGCCHGPQPLRYHHPGRC